MSRSRQPEQPRPRQDKAAPAPKHRESNRDFVEQIVVAFILAFLLRGFEAEAFVIPTGSMAPTLMGQHKEITCPQCGRLFTVNASEENDGSMAFDIRGFAFRTNPTRPGQQVVAGTCDNCRYQVTNLDQAPSFKGDRILVMKFPYALPFLPGANRPKRWDVVVFHYPEQPETNYIKRLVGLPAEELRDYFGDILTRPLHSDVPFQIERKPLTHQQSMQMLVWDDNHRPKAFRDLPDWRRWSPRDKGAGAWVEDADGTFSVTGESATSTEWSELGYRHLVPDPQQWEAALAGKALPRPPRASLITDYYS